MRRLGELLPAGYAGRRWTLEGVDGRNVAAGLLALGALHWTVLVAQAAARDSGETALAAAGFVALEILLLLPLLPVAGWQAGRLSTSDGRRVARVALQLGAALMLVVTYRAGVLSAALLAELGEVSLRQLELWWKHVGPWQLQADLLVYAGAGALLAGRRSDPVARPETAPDREIPERLTVRSGGTVRVLAVEEIRWIEGAGSNVRIHASERSHLLRDTLAGLASRLEPAGFVRVHRSAILNLRYLESLTPAGGGRWEAHLSDGTAVPVAASRMDRLQEAIGDTIGN